MASAAGAADGGDSQQLLPLPICADSRVRAVIASNGGHRERGCGFGLQLVTLHSTDWGVRRDQDTCVWVEMRRAA